MKISTHALLMGTDSPSLTCSDLRKAKAVLEQDYNAVIIPAEDGGYVLLGLCDYSPELLSGVSWGTQLVLEQTRDRLRRLGWRWHELPKRWDVDRPEDLRRLLVDRNVPRPAQSGIGRVKGHNMKRDYLTGKPRPVAGELHKIGKKFLDIFNKEI